MLAKKYLAEIVSVENKVEGIYTVVFAPPPSGSFRYSPGQFLHLSLDADYDGIGQWPESRCFSIQSSPNEAFLKITFAVKGKYTKWMGESLHPGLKLWLKLPFGEFLQKEHSKIKTVFIAGGTGITPFLSLFTYFDFKNYQHPFLYFGLKEKCYNLYEKELNEAKTINPEFEINIKEQIKTGMLNIEEIFNYHKTNSSYFISGTQIMITSFRHYLLNNGVPNENVLTDEWE